MNFPQPRGIHLKPQYTRHWPNQTGSDWRQDHFMFAFVVNPIINSHHFFYSLVFINTSFHYHQNLAPDGESYPDPNMIHFLDPGPDRPLNSAKYSPMTRIFSGCTVSGYPWHTGAMSLNISPSFCLCLCHKYFRHPGWLYFLSPNHNHIKFLVVSTRINCVIRLC